MDFVVFEWPSGNISINGVRDERATLDLPRIYLYDPEAFSELLKFSFEVILIELEEIHFESTPEWLHSGFIILQLKLDYNKETGSVFVIFKVDVMHWSNSYSLYELRDKMRDDLISLRDNKLVILSLMPHDGLIGIGFDIPRNADANLYYHRPMNIMKRAYLKAHKELTQTMDMELIRRFDIPERFQNIFKQYFLYFGDFLKDLTIDNTCKIEEEADQLIFRVEPKDKDIALSEISKALHIYLAVVPGQIESSPSDHTSPDFRAISQWEANISFLKRQLSLKNAELQMKDATIEALQIGNLYLKRFINSNEKDEEEIIKGVVSVGEVEMSGVKVNLAEVFRKLKKLFGK